MLPGVLSGVRRYGLTNLTVRSDRGSHGRGDKYFGGFFCGYCHDHGYIHVCFHSLPAGANISLR
jgi:hypothetical protein